MDKQKVRDRDSWKLEFVPVVCARLSAGEGQRIAAHCRCQGGIPIGRKFTMTCAGALDVIRE